MNPIPSKAVLIVLDGFGIGKDSPFNAINNAQMPFYRDLLARYPHSELITHGEAVGLPPGVMGNSEVGHMTMGAGRIIYQDLTRIAKEIWDKNFFKNEVIRQTMQTGAKATGRVHLMGLLSDGGVHSHMDHLLALLDLAVELGIPHVSVHPFMDGRDTPPNSGPGFLTRLLQHPAFSPGGAKATHAVIASVMGRYYAMDRDKRWDRVQKAYDALTGVTKPFVVDAQSSEPAALQLIQKSHAQGLSDEFIEPTLLVREAAIRDGDSVFFYNYRSDRARELSEAIFRSDFSDFERKPWIKPSAFAGMTVYDKNFNIPVAYGPQNLHNIMGQWLEEKKRTQLRLAETEKYAHVTFFFNGGREQPFIGEERVLIPPNREVATYDLKPEMSAFAIAQAAADHIVRGRHDFMVMNFANADMVGHTGNYNAVIEAVEVLDKCLAQVIGASEKSGYHVLLTADHGNAEEMTDSQGHHHTQHTLNPVPAIWVPPGSANAPKQSRPRLQDGTLGDVMPTLCTLMGLDLPPEVTGKSLLPR